MHQQKYAKTELIKYPFVTTKLVCNDGNIWTASFYCVPMVCKRRKRKGDVICEFLLFLCAKNIQRETAKIGNQTYLQPQKGLETSQQQTRKRIQC